MSKDTDSPNKLEQRAKDFMQSFNTDDIKRRKEEQTVELRKSKRADMASKRRNFQTSDRDWIKVNDHYKPTYSLQDLPELLEAMKSPEPERNLFAAQGFRKLLSIETDPPIQNVIDAGVVPVLIDFIQRHDFPQLQYEAAWAITNIASGTHQHCNVIVEKGSIPLLVNLLRSQNEEVKEQAVWAIGNIGGDSANCRDIILQHDGLNLLLQCVENANKPSMVKNGSWAVSNLCRGKPAANYELVKGSIPLLSKIVQTHHDADLLTDCLWALSHLSEGGEERVSNIIQSECVPKVIQFLNHHLYNIQLPSIRIIGNIVSGSAQQTEFAINVGASQGLSNLLTSSKKNIRKEAVWSISNICAGTQEQLDTLINADVFKKLASIVEHDEKEIKKEAVWALCNAAAAGRPDQVLHLVHCGVIPALCSLFNQSESKMIIVALEGINRILKNGKESFLNEQGNNPFADILEECGGLSKLESLQEHPNNAIYEKARLLIENYFALEEDENDQLIQLIKDNVQFSF